MPGGGVLGTFCMYYDEARVPSPQDRELVAAATYLGRIAIQRDQSDKALREREERLQSIATNLPGMIYRFVAWEDGSVVCEYIGDGVEEIFGLEPEEVTVDASRLVERVHPDDRGWLIAPRGTGKDKLEPVGTEIHVVTDGPSKWIRVY